MTTTKAIDKKIATFTTNVGKLKSLGHEIALLIFDHAHEHNDCTRAIKLCAAMPNSWQPQIEAWFKAFSPIRVILKNGKCELDGAYKKATAENKAAFWDRAAAVATPFYEIMKEPDAEKVYTFEDLMKLAERLPILISKKLEGKHVDPKDIPSVEAMVERLKAMKFERVHIEPANDVAEPLSNVG